MKEEKRQGKKRKRDWLEKEKLQGIPPANGEKTGDGSKGGKERGKEGRERNEMRKNTRKNPTKGDVLCYNEKKGRERKR